MQNMNNISFKRNILFHIYTGSYNIGFGDFLDDPCHSPPLGVVAKGGTSGTLGEHRGFRRILHLMLKSGGLCLRYRSRVRA
jgi:hypothetical protein